MGIICQEGTQIGLHLQGGGDAWTCMDMGKRLCLKTMPPPPTPPTKPGSCCQLFPREMASFFSAQQLGGISAVAWMVIYHI